MLRSSSTQKAMSLPKFPAVKMLKNPVLKSVLGMKGGTLPAGVSASKLPRLPSVFWKKVFIRRPMGAMPGMVPGQMECGHSSFWAGAPSMTGGIFRKVSLSVGNLKPASLKAFPKSLSLGKSRWQVAQDVWYCRENAGIAWLTAGDSNSTRNNAEKRAILPLVENVI